MTLSSIYNHRAQCSSPHPRVPFFDAMQAHPGRVWVHCAANMRVSAFLGLYRVLRQGVAPEAAFDLMHDLWQPNEVWSAFIADALKDRP